MARTTESLWRQAEELAFTCDSLRRIRALELHGACDESAMNPLDPRDAQQVVVEYARVLERDLTENRHPARIDTLPYAKPIIKSAIRTAAEQLAASGQLNDEMRVYLETAYISLADYLENELVELMTRFAESAEALTAEPLTSRERTQSAAWQTLAGSSALAGEVARATANEAEALRSEFRRFVDGP